MKNRGKDNVEYPDSNTEMWVFLKFNVICFGGDGSLKIKKELMLPSIPFNKPLVRP
jgi:hypothetical protein